jgi:hypothetical protein
LTKIKSIGLRTIPIGDITTNFQKYENKTVTIIGLYSINLLGEKFLVDEQNYNIKITCEEPNRVFNLGKKYKATGIVTFNLICDCQERYVLNITEDDWKQILAEFPNASKQNASTYNPNYLIFPEPEQGWFTISDYLGKIDASTCNKRQLFSGKEYFEINVNETHRGRFYTEVIRETRCKPETIEKNYYFKCTEPMIKV